MKSYTALDRTEQNKPKKSLLIGVGVLLIFASISTVQLLPAVIGLLLVYIAFYKKAVVVDENGMTTYYNYLFYKTKVSYGFGEMSAIYVDHGYKDTMIAFIRNQTTTYAAFAPEDGEEVVRMAQEANGRLKVEYGKIKRNKMSL